MGWDTGKPLRNCVRYNMTKWKQVWRCFHEYWSFSKIFYIEAETLPSIQVRRARQTASQGPLNMPQWVIQYLSDVEDYLCKREGWWSHRKLLVSVYLQREDNCLLQKCFWERIPYWNLLWTGLFGKQFSSNILQVVLQLAIITQSNNPSFLNSYVCSLTKCAVGNYISI